MPSALPLIVDSLAKLVEGKPAALIIENTLDMRTSAVFSEVRTRADAIGASTVEVRFVESDQLCARSRLLEAVAGKKRVGDDTGVATDHVAELLDVMAQDSPVVVLLEDLQWSDPSTLLMLGMLPDLLGHLPILWVIGVEARTRRTNRVIAAFAALGSSTVSHGPLATGTDARRPVAFLQVAAVIGNEFDISLVARVLDRSVGSLLPEIEDALASGTLLDTVTRFRFANVQYRRTVYEAMPSSVRRALHYEVAREMGGPGTATETVWHLSKSTDRLTDDDLDAIRETIVRLGAVAPEEAAELAFRVGDLFSKFDPVHIEFLAIAATHLGNTSRIGEALALLERLDVSGLSSAEEARLRWVIAGLHQAAGDDAEAMSHVARALALGVLDDDLRTLLLKTQAAGFVNLGDTDAADQVSRPMLDIACRSEDPATRASADLFASQLAFSQAHVTKALKLAERAADGLEITATRPLHPPRLPELWLATAMLSSDRAEEAAGLLLSGQRHAEQKGLAWSIPYWHTVRAIERWLHGELDDAAAEAETALHAAASLDIVRPLPWTRAVLAIVETDRGHAEQASRLLEGSNLSPSPRTYDIWTAAAWTRLASGPGAQQAGTWMDQHLNTARLMALPPKVWPSLPVPGHVNDRLMSLLQDICAASPDQDVIASAVKLCGRSPRDGIGKDPQASDSSAWGWSSLTSSELRVVRLAVTGHTNRAIAHCLHVSVHTVGTHLRHAYTKLDINTRVELTRRAIEHDSTLLNHES